MLYRDPLYGEWELPRFLEKISQTKEMVRLRGITQSVLPNKMTPYGTIPSRFHHGLGVAYLATKVLEKTRISRMTEFYCGRPPCCMMPAIRRSRICRNLFSWK